MTKVVLDARAIIAVLISERGFEHVNAVIADGVVSVVNESEVVTKLIQQGQTPEQVSVIVQSMPYQVVDLDRHLAVRAGVLWPVTKPQGLSFADRCCLALAEKEGLPVFTADRSWAGVSLGVEIRLIR